MTLPPLWKIKRELIRPWHRLLAAPESIFTRFFGSHYYDRFLSANVMQSDGSIPLADKVAVYVVFPANGLLDSHLVALSYLTSHGYAPLVVSNLPLDARDREKLLDYCWLCIERPNFGYDFGGYREGILTVADRAPDVGKLLLLNDSCWFPLPGGADWLTDAENLELDLAAAATNFGHPRVEARDYRSIQWNYRTTHKNFHYCSFSLMLSGRVLRDDAFLQFWRRFPLSNRKRSAVRRGEIGLTKWIMEHGYSHGTTHGISDLDTILADLGEDELETVAKDLIVPEAPRILALKQRLLSSRHDRRDLEALILTTVAYQGSSYALTPFLYRHAGYPFLKKSPVWLDRDASDLTIAFAQGLDGEFGHVIVREAIELRSTRAPSFGSLALTPDRKR